MGEGALRRRHIVRLAAPGLLWRGLQRAAIGEGERPRQIGCAAFIALRCAVASSSDCPPDRNAMPGTADGTQCFSTFTVRSATSSTPAACRPSCR